MAVFTVLGAGMMGSALCVPLADRGHAVRLVGTHLDREIIDSVRERGHHPTLRCDWPAGIVGFHHEQFEEAFDGCDALALGVSSAGVRWAADVIAPHVTEALPIVSITKGLAFDGERLRVLPDVLCESFDSSLSIHPAAIAGPCIAGELARRVPTCVVIAGRDQSKLDALADLIRTDYFHVWTSTDLEGVEVCAALKNAYAMGVAFGAGVHASRGGEPGSVAMHNYESAVFAQAIGEMNALVRVLGGSTASVMGLAGVGDLDVTNNGGRTGRFGRWLGTGLTRDDAIEKMAGATLECLEIIAVMREATRVLMKRGAVPAGSFPLLEHMAAVVIDGAEVDVPFASFFGGAP